GDGALLWGGADGIRSERGCAEPAAVCVSGLQLLSLLLPLLLLVLLSLLSILGRLLWILLSLLLRVLLRQWLLLPVLWPWPWRLLLSLWALRTRRLSRRLVPWGVSGEPCWRNCPPEWIPRRLRQKWRGTACRYGAACSSRGAFCWVCRWRNAHWRISRWF